MLRAVGSTAIGAGKLIGSLAGITPGLFLKRRRAMHTFKAKLQEYGIDGRTAEELTEIYKQLGDIKQWIDKH